MKVSFVQYYGYSGKILYVDLSRKEATPRDLPLDLAKAFIGARGFGAKILWDMLPRGVDPFSPENVLVIAVGPLAGTAAQSASRWFVMFKSPLTGTYFRTVGGGFFGAMLKFAGYDAIVVKGRAEKPTYIWIHEDHVEFRDAIHIWGMTVDGAREFLLEETDKDAKFISIGPAGERLVRFAAIVSDDYRTAGRGGGGAVMGSKNLKAIVVYGRKMPKIYNEELFRKAVEEQIESYKKNPVFEGFHSLGTNFAVYPFYTLGHFPTYNFKQLELENVDRFKPEVLGSYVVKHYGCYGCIIRCGKKFKLTKGPHAGLVWDFPEYETHWSFGGTLGVTNIEAITYANYLADRYGLDTISTGAVIAFAIELYEKGIISKRETDGLELKWGDPEVLVELVRKMALREGIGNILAEGVKRAAEIIGRGAEKYAMHGKGLELPAYDPRAAKAHGLSFATANIGGSHCIGWNKFEILGIPRKVDPFSIEGKGELAKYVQDETAMFESAGFCLFPICPEMITAELLSKLLYYATGIEEFKDPKYLWLVGERVYNLEKAINVREGVGTREYDTLPERILKEPVPRPPAKGQIFELDKLLDDYYKVRGWDVKTGLPTRKKLEELGLKDVAETLEKLGIKLPE
jgi:aldehyde:ferredoxin oxidoreductase